MKQCQSAGAMRFDSRTTRNPRFIYFDDVLARRLRPELFTSEDALEQAKAFARAELDKDRTEASV